MFIHEDRKPRVRQSYTHRKASLQTPITSVSITSNNAARRDETPRCPPTPDLRPATAPRSADPAVRTTPPAAALRRLQMCAVRSPGA